MAIKYSLNKSQQNQIRPQNMLSPVIGFFLISLITGIFGFVAFEGKGSEIIKILFFVLSVIFIISLILNRRPPDI